ncbi:hypothetical protein [Rhizobium straminoryzae]|uniref:Uncharacterized protein n=1 Tax=Rhizobium straminoryzae TaxID=1387186 RepID=A0A549SR15_9HYPH|nr:hypothetical protein [Rhizobium straminoryzae]TRL32037.1 hypothetical protein FNA46_23935 [Rhizobium straminoryzae]
MDLDQRYGSAVPPQAHGLRQGEDMFAPRSLVMLAETDDAPGIVGFMRAVQESCALSGFLSGGFTILWIIDREGALRIAVEEAFSDGDRRIPLINDITAMLQQSGWSKLGHPSLLNEDKLGRIAGEATFLPEDNVWEINNLSGRYGLGLDRTATHLENVAGILRASGLRIIIDFNQLRMA